MFDTGEDPKRFRAIAERERGAHFESGPNRGYAGGANHLLRQIDRYEPDAGYVLVLNPDVQLDPSFSRVLVDASEADPRVALSSGKLLRPGRTRIDSAGIVLPRHRRPRDRGSEELDRGQYNRCEYVFGVSGAAVLLRRAALPCLAIDGEIFDEDFFVYHEDTDLAWRAHRLGWEVLYEPAATAVHVRGWRKARRFEVPLEARRHSFKNHYLQLIKNERGGDFARNLPWLAVWELLRIAHSVFRDPAILKAYGSLGPALRSARRKRQTIAAKCAVLASSR